MSRKRQWSGLAVAVLTLLTIGWASAPASAHIVALDIDLPLDQIATGRPFKVGDHHHARIFYDDTAIDPKTHRVRVLHMQHLMGPGQWVPARLDAVEMPMIDAWLDLSHAPYRYHYRSAVIAGGEPVLVDFDAQTRRMTIRLQSDESVIISAPYAVDPTPVPKLDTQSVFRRPPAYVALAMDVAIDQAVAGEPDGVGSHDQLHLIFDASEIDEHTHRVPLKNMQHLLKGKYLPAHTDPVFMPVTDAWLDLSREPYAMHFRALVVHGKPIIIDADEHTHRLAIRPQDHPEAVLIAGPYTIDPRPITGPEITEAATPAAPGPTTASTPQAVPEGAAQ
jgi:hypothetical protein